ncbi:hypothetical protein Tco_1374931, partial [Tanacetum coccineum]
STSGVLVSADAVTTLSTTFAQFVSVLVPPLSVTDHEVVHAGPRVEDPSSGKIVCSLIDCLKKWRLVEREYIDCYVLY